MEISIKRVSYLSCFGFLIVFALACASSGCVGSPDEVSDDDVMDPVDPIEPELGTWTESGDEVLPPAPEEPEIACGLPVAVEHTVDVPAPPPAWHQGQPFTVGDRIGYADSAVIEGSLDTWSVLTIHVFEPDGGFQTYPVENLQWSEDYGFEFHVMDVLVEDDMVRVLWSRSVFSMADGHLAYRSIVMTTILAGTSLMGTEFLWSPNGTDDMYYGQYQLVRDDIGLVLGIYHVNDGHLGFRRLLLSGSSHYAGLETVVRSSDDRWAWAPLLPLKTDGQTLTFRNQSGTLQSTVSYRSCD